MTIIHRYWHDLNNLPAYNGWNEQMIEKFMPGAELRDWDTDSVPVNVYEGLTEKVNEDDLPRHMANLVKWWALAKYGGIWLDHDVIPLGDLRTSTPFMAALPGQWVACVVNLPQPHHPLAVARLEDMQTYTHPSGRTPYVSGDKALARKPVHGVKERMLPFDAVGNRIPNAVMWCLHLWETSSKRHLERMTNG